MDKINIKPLGDRVVLEPLNDKERQGKTKAGIYIPDTADKERPEKGKIIAVGPGRKNEKGDLIPLELKKSQIVLFSKYGPNEIKVDGKEYLIAKEDDILAILE
ncbi:MAG: co-chaperone GroES [Candidatus Tagabacteria bacterium RIFCSPLOWO2_01_FULL_39_11]|uniref:Co-chaperonin GroES n=1 Tax=Candidatus Tagabacteria bacterium RIFCSPLOWO2_01_FULL_39_11 TaxID=1802295 RepID=A0A1G2LQL8_9BACT|nr:MAG: co-chaperone GroES [Candidatus Tagabacteria bacterium RIFCSPLOWO2_01_FULL_39_11]